MRHSRHTFARILLERHGVIVRDVAELLGNTEQVVRKHYSAWNPERQERLTAVLKGAFSGKPRPKLFELSKDVGGSQKRGQNGAEVVPLTSLIFPS
jgi:hypothetical protein